MGKLIEKLSKIQQEMKAPKNLWNKFGNYSYRNAEGILEALKPFEEKYKVAVVLHDDVFNVGDRYYIKAEATLYDTETEESITTSALARESESKKGMDDSQITGTASSYARKYALNGLFLLDDTKDADTDEYQKQTQQKEEIHKIKAAHVKTLENCIPKHGQTIEKVCSFYNVKSLADMTIEQFDDIMKRMGE